jgi:ABC-type sulfate transport system permease component
MPAPRDVANWRCRNLRIALIPLTNYIATIGLAFLFIADYIGIIVWLMRSANVANHTIRFSMRGLFLAMTFVAIHVAMFAAFLSELAPKATS